jgi:hypothetical protein
MNNSIIDFALSDFDLGTEEYNKFKHEDLMTFTDKFINSDSVQQDCLQMSQQILLNNKQMLLDTKKKVAFDVNDSPEYDAIIRKESETYNTRKKKSKSLHNYDIPICEYIDVCMSNTLKKKKDKSKTKYKNF